MPAVQANRSTIPCLKTAAAYPADERVLIKRRGGLIRICIQPRTSVCVLDERLVQSLTQNLLAHRDDPNATSIELDFAPPGGLVFAGADLGELARASNWGVRGACIFLGDTYRLIDLIRRYPKPVSCRMDGSFFGSAVGVAAAAEVRSATSRTSIQFPECGIGLSPDAAATWYLPRLRGFTGIWLALSGAALSGRDLLAAGFCQLMEADSPLPKSATGHLEDAPYHAIDHVLAVHGDEIERSFCYQHVNDILAALGEGSSWARSQRQCILARSPVASSVTLRQLGLGSIIDDYRVALRLEYRILTRLVCAPDFREGVKNHAHQRQRAPRWSPSKLSRVTPDTLAPFFAPLRDGELQFVE
ncbi:MAG: enoyl-CoA hydratase/isomerase family protein [Parvibaculaceae bacterium]